MTIEQLHPHKSMGSEREEVEVAMRLRRSNSHLRRLLALCANSLDDTLRATQDLSGQVSALRDEIELLLRDGRRANAQPFV